MTERALTGKYPVSLIRNTSRLRALHLAREDRRRRIRRVIGGAIVALALASATVFLWTIARALFQPD